MLDTLPNELLDNVYSWLPLSSIRKTTRKLSKRHHEFSIRRLVASIDGLRISLDTESGNKHRMCIDNYRAVVLDKSTTSLDTIRFKTDTKFSRSAEPLFVCGDFAATEFKIGIPEDPENGNMHDKLNTHPFAEIVGVKLVGGVPF
ncbi:hypothetical protein HDU98_003018 [Podochytrium sp. JEL0797]|nr:hypothetical protein HDU98_003018 [Podochytrium sp. JEL0797]